MHPIIQKESGYSLETHAIPKIPHEITLIILNSLMNLQDVNSFLTTSHAALTLRPHIWFIWAKKYGYQGDFKGGRQYLQDFFFKIAKVAKYTAFPSSWRVDIEVRFQKGAPKQKIINGYLTAERVLNTSTTELRFILANRWIYRIPELLFLTKKASGPYFKDVFNPYYIKTELLNPAAKLGELSQIKFLCELIDDPNLNDMGFAPIHAAASAGQESSIKLLSEYGASVNALWRRVELKTTAYTYYIVEYFHTPLDLAYHCNSESAVRALLEAHVDPEKEFMKSCIHAHLNMLKIFLELAPTCPLDAGLESCFQNNHPLSLPCAELLLMYGANPNKANNRQETLLYRSVMKGNLDFIHLFCQFGANLDARNTEGKSPLFIAITGTTSKVKRLEIVQILCEYGANFYALDPKGRKTLLQHAYKSKKMRKLLKSIVAKRALNFQ
jgi:ankyrin repeat protein